MDGKGRLITFLHLQFVNVFSHSPIVEVLRLLQDDPGLQMCTRRLSFPFSRSLENFVILELFRTCAIVNFEIFGTHHFSWNS